MHIFNSNYYSIVFLCFCFLFVLCLCVQVPAFLDSLTQAAKKIRCWHCQYGHSTQVIGIKHAQLLCTDCEGGGGGSTPIENHDYRLYLTGYYANYYANYYSNYKYFDGYIDRYRRYDAFVDRYGRYDSFIDRYRY